MIKLFFFFVFILSFEVQAQFCKLLGGEVLGRSYVQTYHDLKSMPYTHLREADVMWGKRTWRVIDLREKINHPLFFPVDPIPSRVSFMQMVMDALTCGESKFDLTGFDVLDDEFTVRLTKSEVIEKSFSKEEITYEDEFGETKSELVDNPFDFFAVKRLRVKEDWYFDRQRSSLNVRIIGICPVQEVFDEMGEFKGERPMFWLYFPELRVPMSKTIVFNTKNQARYVTYDQWCAKRIFSSYIYKESNVFDRKIDTYKQDLDLLLESKKIEHEIFTLEQDLWEY